MYQMDAQHTGRSPNRGPREARVLSTFDTSKYPVRDGTTSKPDIQSSAAIGPDGSIYIGNHQGVLFALQDAPSAAGDAHSLELSWRFHPPEGSSWHATPALSPDGTVYLGFSRPGSGSDIEGTLYALRAPSGGAEADIVCGRSVDLCLRDHPGINAHITSVSPPAGANGIGSGASPTVAADGTVYVGANNSNFYAITQDGELHWMYEAEREIAGIWSTAALSDDESVLYFGANKGGMYALNRADGSLAWRYPIVSSIYNSPALAVDGVLYTGSTIGHVYALDSHTGRAIFDYDAGAPIWTAPAIRPDGSLVVADRNGRVIVLG